MKEMNCQNINYFDLKSTNITIIFVWYPPIAIIMEWQLILPPLLSVVFGVTSAIFTFRSYMNNRYWELGGIALGFALFSLQPLIQLFFVSFPNPEFVRVAQFFGQIAISAVILGLIIIWFSLQHLSGSAMKPRHYFEVSATLIGLGYTVRSFQVTMVENSWTIEYDPSYAFILAGIPLTLIIVEILWLAYQTRKSREEHDWGNSLIFVGWLILALSIVSLMIERSISGTTLYYQIVASLGNLVIAIVLIKRPYAIVPKIIGAKYINISYKRSGISIIEQSFEDKTDDEGRSSLFASAMKAIVDMLGELTGRKEVPKEFGYATYKIMIVEKDELIGYVICYNPINPLRTIIEELLEELNEITPNVSYFENSQLQDFEETVNRKLQPVL